MVEAESTITAENTYVSISELHPFYTYDITVAAITTGIGPKSPEYSITMPESGKPLLSMTGVHIHHICIKH